MGNLALNLHTVNYSIKLFSIHILFSLFQRTKETMRKQKNRTMHPLTLINVLTTCEEN